MTYLFSRTGCLVVGLIFLLTALGRQSRAQCNPLVYNAQFHSVAAAPTMSLNLVSDFCAVGNGQVNDYDAFARARNFIAARGGHCTLYIPGGTYKVNAQDANNAAPGGGGALEFNVTISHVDFLGDSLNPTLIRYAPGQYYGFFASANSPVPQNGGAGGGVARTPFDFLMLDSASYVRIRHIHAHGNKDSTNIGGYSTASGNTWQIGGSGVCISNSAHHISMEHCAFEGFCLDGIIMLSTDSTATPPTAIEIKNTHCPKNGRNGISPCSSYDLSIKKCSFNENATGVFWQEPGMGIDFEPDHHNAVFVRNARLDSVISGSNRGLSLALQGDPIYGAVNDSSTIFDVRFYNSLFCDFDNLPSEAVNANVFVMADSLYFEQCTFAGEVQRGCFSAGGNMHASTFKSCRFTDSADQNGNYRSLGYRLYSGGACADLNFLDCSFAVDSPLSGLIYTHAAHVNDLNSNTVFENCSFTFGVNNQMGYSGGGASSGKRSKIAGATFKGNNTIVNRHPNQKLFHASGWNIVGSNDPCNPATLVIDSLLWVWYSQVYDCPQNQIGVTAVLTAQPLRIGKFNVGNMPANSYADLVLKRQAYFKFSTQGACGPPFIRHSIVQLGTNARLISSSGTTVKMLGDTLENFGQLIFDQYGTNWFDSVYVPANMPHATELFFLHKNRYVTSAIAYNLNAQCATGKHPLFNGGPFECTPNYDSVAWNSTFTFLYSIVYNGCSWNANVNYMVKGGTPPYSVSINNAGPPFTGLGNGQYTVQVVDAQLCSATFTIQVAGPQPLQFAAPVVTPLQCNGGTNGQIVVAASGGTGTLTYSINPNVGAQAPAGTFTGLTAQNYTITATDVNGCTSSTAVNVMQPAAMAFTSVSPTDVSCNGGTNGQIVVAASGGTGTLTYSINPNVGAQAPVGTFTGLTAQNYTITAADVNGCTSSTAVNIMQPAAVALTSVTPTDVSCNGGTNGQIVVAAFGGTGTLTYAMTPNVGIQSPAGTFTGLTAQNYTITATDVNGCTSTTAVNITQPAALAWNAINLTNINCSTPMSGGVQVQASGGTGPYSYSISPNASQSPAGNFAPLVAGNYSVSATDANGCTLTTSITDLLNPQTGDFCGCPNGENLILTTPGLLLKINPTASGLKAQYGNPIVGKVFYVDGILTIDEDITFDGCTLWFTPQAQVQVQGGHQLGLNLSTLDAACDWWLGIEAFQPQNKIVCLGGNINHALWGIYVSDNAVAEVSGTSFVGFGYAAISFNNISDAGYTGYAAGCTITSTGNQPVAANTQHYGIQARNVRVLTLGDANNPNNGNVFQGMRCGIYLYGDANMAGVIGSGSNQINLYNNRFSDIGFAPDQSNYSLYMSSIYNQPKGAGVYIDYTQAPAFEGHTEVRYTGNATAATPTFEHCYKAIVSKGNHLWVEKQYIRDCDFGIMNHTLMSRDLLASENSIEDAHIGIQAAGTYRDYSIRQNSIRVSAGAAISNAGFGMMAMMYPAIGIDIKQMNQPYNPAEAHIVEENAITLPYYAGKGIANLGSNQSQVIWNNTMLFTVPQGTAYPALPYQDPGLYGIYNSNGKDFTLDNNLVDGQYTQGVYSATYSKAYYFETCKEMILSCNKARATKQGLYAWGDNHTSEKKIHHNKFKFNLNPLYTLDAANAGIGTFGDIGDGADDNMNDWLYNTNNKSYLQSQWYKIWRNSTFPSQDKILTVPALLDMSLGESGSPGGITNPYRYGVENANINPVSEVCAPDPLFDNSAPPVVVITTTGTDIDYAESIATQNATYINFAQVGQWLDNRWLFERLARDTALRYSSPVLNSFYSNFQNTTIGKIEQSDLILNALFDFSGSDSAFIILYNEALNKVGEIVSIETHELNERTVNELAVLMGRYGTDSISALQKLELEVLANTCPFIGGSAVYKARLLWTAFNPMAQYNDRLLCLQGLGQNKNGNIGYTNLDSLYETQVNQDAQILSEQLGLSNQVQAGEIRVGRLDHFEDILLYPNPANDHITISNHVTTGILELLDATGRLVFSHEINTPKAATIQLPKLSNGLYNYKLILAGGMYSGKLNIHQHD